MLRICRIGVGRRRVRPGVRLRRRGHGASLTVGSRRGGPARLPAPGPKLRNSGSVAAPSAPAMAPKLPRSSAGGVRASATARRKAWREVSDSRSTQARGQVAVDHHGRHIEQRARGQQRFGQRVGAVGQPFAGGRRAAARFPARRSPRAARRGTAGGAAARSARRGRAGCPGRRAGRRRAGAEGATGIMPISPALPAIAAHALSAERQPAADRRADEHVEEIVLAAAVAMEQLGDAGGGAVVLLDDRQAADALQIAGRTPRPPTARTPPPTGRVRPANCRDCTGGRPRCRRSAGAARPAPAAPAARRHRAPDRASVPAAAAMWSCVRCDSTVPPRSVNAVSMRVRSSRTPIA